MSIIIYEGNPGSGKTYDAVRKVIANLAKGRRILSNIDGFNTPFSQEVIKHVTNLDDFNFEKQLIYLTDEEVLRFWEIAKTNDMIVIDEAQKYFNARKWQSKNNELFSLWADEHRHNGQDVLLIAPKAKKIESGVRDIAEWIYQYKKINMFGGLVSKKYIRFSFVSGDPDPIGKVVATYDPLIFKCYQSYFLQDAKETGIQKGANILKHPVFFILPIVLILFIITLSKSSILGEGVFGNKALNSTNQKSIEKIQPDARLNSVGVEPVQVDYNIIGYTNGKKIIKTDKGIIIE